MNILNLLIEDGIDPVHASGDEYHSACPICGGKDRFSCWPGKVNSNGRYLGGRFICRQCGWYGDAAGYLMKRQGLSFRDAVKALGIDPGRMPGHKTGGNGWMPSPPKPEPCEQWQDQAGRFMLSCADALYQDKEKMEWLGHERGLKPEMIRRFKLGWNSEDRWADRGSWGLPEAARADRKPKRLWLPAGLVIPFFPGGKVIRLRVRRDNPRDGARYVMVSGSSSRAMFIGHAKNEVIVVESELDAILLSQEAGDLADAVAMGSAQAKPDATLHDRLMKASLVLVSLDADTAGASAAWRFWRRYPGFRRWPAIRGAKDPCEMMRDGVPIRSWIEAGMGGR